MIQLFHYDFFNKLLILRASNNENVFNYYIFDEPSLISLSTLMQGDVNSLEMDDNCSGGEKSIATKIYSNSQAFYIIHKKTIRCIQDIEKCIFPFGRVFDAFKDYRYAILDKEKYIFNEVFNVWHYYISHHMLLIRGKVDNKNIDIFFMSVEYMNIPFTMRGIEIFISNKNVESFSNDLNQELYGNVYSIIVNGTEYFIIAGKMVVMSNDLSAKQLPYFEQYGMFLNS